MTPFWRRWFRTNLAENCTSTASVDARWGIAQQVSGSDKIRLVERLAKGVEDRPDIRAWLLRYGCENDIAPEYLAYACATGGDLAMALSAKDIDEELLDGACVIVCALLRDPMDSGPPAADIEAYDDGVQAVQHLVRHLQARCDTLEHLQAVVRIHDWVEWPRPRELAEHEKRPWWHGPPEIIDKQREQSWIRRQELGWTAAIRADLATTCSSILRQPRWPEQLRAALAIDWGYVAWTLSRAIGVDLWDEIVARLPQEPLNSWLYQFSMQTDDLDRVKYVLQFAEEHLPLNELATGPPKELGIGEEGVRCCLSTIVQEMRRDGVFSSKLVAAALRSPLTFHRRIAAAALQARPTTEWGSLAKAALRKAADEEPRSQSKATLQALVRLLDGC